MSAPSRTVVALAPNSPGAIVTKWIICSMLGGDSPTEAADIARDQCRGLPHLEHAFRQKAAVGAQGVSGTDPYTGAQWFGALASNLQRQLTPLFSVVPFRTHIPVEAAAGSSAAWLGQGLPIPSLKTTTSTIVLDYFKLATAVAFSKELARFGLHAEAALLQIVRAAWDKAVSQQLLDSTIGPTNARPASLTFGCNSIASSGSTAANIVTDLSALIALIETPAINLRWLMQPKTFYTIASRLGGVGLHISVDDLFGIPCLLAANGPKQITLLDCAAVAYASDDQIGLDVTSQATIEMSDAPGQSGIAGTGATMVSLYQSGLIAVKIDAGMSWMHLYYDQSSPSVPSGCVFMPTTY